MANSKIASEDNNRPWGFLYEHPTDLHYVLLSRHVFLVFRNAQIQSGHKVEFPTDKQYHQFAAHNHLLQDWHVAARYEDEKKPGRYFGVLYVNEQKRQAVLAHRGVDIDESLELLSNKDASLSAAFKMLTGTKGSYYDRLIRATKSAVDVSSKANYILSFTGHTFGGVLAKISLQVCNRLIKGIEFNHKAVGFDCPGDAGLLDTFESNIKTDNLDYRTTLNVVTYLSYPHLVNIAKGHFGKVYQIADKSIVEMPKGIKIDEEFGMARDVHLDVFLKVFDHITGRPKLDSLKQLLDMPSAEYDFEPCTMKVVKKVIEAIPIPEVFKNIIFFGLEKAEKKALTTNTGAFYNAKLTISMKTKKVLEELVDLKDPNCHELLKHYETADVKLNEELSLMNWGSVDWYLGLLFELKQDKLIGNAELIGLKRKYRIDPPNNGMAKFVTTWPDTSLDNVRDHMTSLMRADSEVKKILCGQSNTEKIIESIRVDAAELVSSCSPSNISKETRQNNTKVFEQLKNLVDHVKNNESHFWSDRVDQTDLINVLFIINALANNYMYSNHDWRTAVDLLLGAKKLAETYALRKVRNQPVFDGLDLEKRLTQLGSVNHLPEIYTMTMYLLGKSFIYRDYDEAETVQALEYFKVTKHFGQELGLFEGYLTDVRGVGILKKKSIELRVADGDCGDEVKNVIKDLIEMYEEFKKDVNEYIVEYRPDQTYKNLKRIVPAEDEYNLIDCTERLTRLYGMQLKITDDGIVRMKCLNNFNYLYIGTKEVPGLLKRLSFDTKFSGRKFAVVFNTLGEILLKLYDYKLNWSGFKRNICNEMKNLKVDGVRVEDGDLQLIEAIFKKARSKSEVEQFPEADAYKGLAMVYERMLQQGGLDASIAVDIERSLKSAIEKRDKINVVLNRTNLDCRN